VARIKKDASEILPAGVVEQAVALYLAGDSPRLIGS
jgi:hypothetical protein